MYIPCDPEKVVQCSSFLLIEIQTLFLGLPLCAGFRTKKSQHKNKHFSKLFVLLHFTVHICLLCFVQFYMFQTWFFICDISIGSISFSYLWNYELRHHSLLSTVLFWQHQQLTCLNTIYFWLHIFFCFQEGILWLYIFVDLSKIWG